MRFQEYSQLDVILAWRYFQEVLVALVGDVLRVDRRDAVRLVGVIREEHVLALPSVIVDERVPVYVYGLD
jgi:hypothetical protein